MAGTLVSATEALVAGGRMEFRETYKREITTVNARVSKLAKLNLPSSTEIERFPYFTAAPHPKRWDRGETISEGAFKSRAFNVTNRDWGIRVPWHENDEKYDKTGSLVEFARDAGRSMALLVERVIFQILTGSTDADLLPAVPLAADGVALFSATDGSGAARYGVTGGNLRTGAGLGSALAITSDLYAVLSAFRRFLDGQGQPLWPPEMLAQGVLIVYGSSYDLVFAQAFMQRFQQGQAAAPSNLIGDAGLKYELWSTPRITDGSWFAIPLGILKKAIVQTIASQLRENLADLTNSDRARDSKVKYLQFDMSAGFGIAEAFNMFKVVAP